MYMYVSACLYAYVRVLEDRETFKFDVTMHNQISISIIVWIVLSF